MYVLGVNNSINWLKNDPKRPKFDNKSVPKVKICKNSQKMTTVDARGHPKLHPSTRETMVIEGNYSFFYLQIGGHLK